MTSYPHSISAGCWSRVPAGSHSARRRVFVPPGKPRPFTTRLRLCYGSLEDGCPPEECSCPLCSGSGLFVRGQMRI